MGRYKIDPTSGVLDHAYAVEALSRRLRAALGDWVKYQAFDGDPMRVLKDALTVTLGKQTVDQIVIMTLQESSST